MLAPLILRTPISFIFCINNNIVRPISPNTDITKAINGLDVSHYDLRFIKPLDKKLLHSIFKTYQSVITVEDGVIKGGFGSSILEFVSDNEYKINVHRLGIPDEFIHHGTQNELWNDCNIDTSAVIKKVENLMKKHQISRAG